MTTLLRDRAAPAPALLSGGFRPFFLLAGVWAAVAVPLWLLLAEGRADIPAALPPVLWHAHEMVFGFGLAVVAGFLLTAIPNWTGREPLQGTPLALLALLWMAGRAAMLWPGGLDPLARAAFDFAFPAAFLLVAAREILAGRNWRNLPVLGAVGLLLGADLLIHAGATVNSDLAMAGARLGIATLLALIALIGGRIIPAFTRNWLVQTHPAGVALPAAFGALDRAALGLAVAALALWVALPGTRLTGAALLAAGGVNAVRLLRWRGAATLREPLLWVLHLGYAWLALGLLLLGASLWGALLPSAALHALTVGAIGTMTAAVMARASLGHTGRPLTAGPGCAAVFGLITCAAVLRLAAPVAADHARLLLDLSGASWSCGFGLFAALFARPLCAPRRRGTSGG